MSRSRDPVFVERNLSAEIRKGWGPRWNEAEESYVFGKRRFTLIDGQGGIYSPESAAPQEAPVANFSAIPTSGNTPLTVAFSDASSNSPTSWLWEKNDGSGWSTFSTSQNPTTIL